MTLLLDSPLVHSLSRRAAGPRGGTVIVLHAHPDDEAIFTGATIRRLADRGVRVVLVTATGGELGEILTPLRPGERVAQRRTAELAHAADLLGVARVVALGRRDSGLAGWVDNDHADALANTRVGSLARALARVVVAEDAQALVHYDVRGIYEHPDHLAVHQVGRLAAQLAGATAYEATLDAAGLPTDADRASGRGHLVQAASTANGARWPNGAAARSDGARIWDPPGRTGGGATPLGGTRPGSTAFDAALWIDGTPAELAVKRAAMLAHASQIRPESVPASSFARTYGREWYFRVGLPSVLDTLLAPEPAPSRPPGGTVGPARERSAAEEFDGPALALV